MMLFLFLVLLFKPVCLFIGSPVHDGIHRYRLGRHPRCYRLLPHGRRVLLLLLFFISCSWPLFFSPRQAEILTERWRARSAPVREHFESLEPVLALR